VCKAEASDVGWSTTAKDRRHPRRWGRTRREAALHPCHLRYAETRRGNSGKSGASLVTVELQAGSTATHRVSQPSRSKIRLRRPRRGRGRAAPVGFDDLDGRVWVSFGVANACYGYTGVCQGGGDRGEVKAGGKGGPVGGCRCCAWSRVCERPWVVK
jgi:hypothetical protein